MRFESKNLFDQPISTSMPLISLSKSIFCYDPIPQFTREEFNFKSLKDECMNPSEDVV